MATIEKAPTLEVSVTEARDDFARLVRDAEYGAATYDITRHGKVVARLVGPDAGRMPDPELWQKAQEAYDRAINSDWYRQLPITAQSALAALAALPRAYYGYDQEG